MLAYRVIMERLLYFIDKVLCADKKADIAILEFVESTDLVPLELLPDDHLERGAPVWAIGSPKGLKNSVTSGIISYQYTDEWGIPQIQISAPISPGSSGGALFNSDGKVIGVTSATYASKDEYGRDTNAQNLNFAVNISVAQAMYNAWDGKKYSIKNSPTVAKMDFTGVYVHTAQVNNDSAIIQKPMEESSKETWICINCGKENTTNFCLNCGAKKPYWVCSCGKANLSNKFCGDCGKGIDGLVALFNKAIGKENAHDYAGAVTDLTELGQFNSGSFDTVAGKDVDAQYYICKVYYDQGIYLQSHNGSHEEIIAAFSNAGDYGDAKEQIGGEKARHSKAFYDAGIKYLDNGEYEEAIDSFLSAGDYPGAAEQIQAAYYGKGCKLLADKEYEKAAMLFGKAGDYSDSTVRASEAYYLQAEEFLKNGDTEKAVDFFSKAGDYKDSKDRIAQIEDGDKITVYNSAINEFNKGNYEQASALFAEVAGYKDADNKAVDAIVLNAEQQLAGLNTDPDTMSEKDQAGMESILSALSKYRINAAVNDLYKQISYTIAQYWQKSSVDTAIQYFQQAGDYLDASEQVYACKVAKLEQLIDAGRMDEAIQYYRAEIDQAGNGQEYVLIKPKAHGKYAKTVLSLVEPLGIKTKGQIDEDYYKEEYIPYVKAVESHFGMTADGLITFEEYNELTGAIYQGSKSKEISILLEKLAKLSYISSLPADHSKYEASYVRAVKKAELDLGLLVDGIVTQSEYTLIMNKRVPALAAPKIMTVVRETSTTVILKWDQVPEADRYEVRRGSIVLGETKNRLWLDKDAPSDSALTYYIRAKKNNISSDEVFYTVGVFKKHEYIYPDSLANNLSEYLGKYVAMGGYFDAWWIKDSNGNFFNDTSAATKAMTTSGYDIYVMCRWGRGYVEFVMEDYKSWVCPDDLRTKIMSSQYVDVKGIPTGTAKAPWKDHPNIPSVTVDSITWGGTNSSFHDVFGAHTPIQ